MSTRWKVKHKFSEPLEVATTLPAYTSLGVTFSYSPDGRLIEVAHEVELDDAAIEDHARELSNRTLRLLFDALEYRRGVPVRIANVHGFRIDPPSMSMSLHATATVSVDAVVVRPIRFPSEAAMSAAGPRLTAWLHIANRACHERDEYAVRDYFLIVEEALGTNLPAGSTAECVKFVRHFVSHPKLTNANVIAFINKELGLPPSATCPAYDPRDAAQRAMLRRWRVVARQLAENELDKLL